MSDSIISEEEIQRIYKLSRLNPTSNNSSEMAKELSRIVSYFDSLLALKTDEVEETCHVHKISNVFREDKVVDSLSVEDALKETTETSGNFFEVPLVVDDK